MESSNQLDLPRVREETWIPNVSFHHEVDSTNTVAVNAVTQGCELPLLVVADRQTAGRGRGSNQWWSGPGALTFTLAIGADGLDPIQVCKVSLTAGLAICQALQRFLPAGDFGLKWPNDVFLDGRKVCGILIERPAGTVKPLIVGIGINVNNSIASGPEDLQSRAIALADRLHVQLDLTSVLIECLRQLQRRIDELRQGEVTLIDQWRCYCLLTGKQVTIDTFGAKIRGVCRGVDEDGALLVVSQDELHRCVAGVVETFSSSQGT